MIPEYPGLGLSFETFGEDSQQFLCISCPREIYLSRYMSREDWSFTS